MRRRKPFWVSFAITLAVLLPIYAAVALWCGLRLSRAQTADNAVSGIRVLQPTGEDRRTLLVMTGGATARTPESFVLLRLDALHGTVCAAALPEDTVLLCGGAPATLAEAVESAGPAQGAVALAETFRITVDGYLFAAPETLAAMAEPLGPAGVRLDRFLSAETLGALQLSLPGSRTTLLTPRMASALLRADEMPQSAVPAVRAQCYAAFLRRGTGLLEDTLPAAVRANAARLATDLDAQELLNYERILRFLDRSEAEFSSGVPDSTLRAGRRELTEQAAAWMTLHFA